MPKQLKPAEGGVYWLYRRKVRTKLGITVDLPDEAVPKGAFGHMCIVIEQTKSSVKIMMVYFSLHPVWCTDLLKDYDQSFLGS